MHEACAIWILESKTPQNLMLSLVHSPASWTASVFIFMKWRPSTVRWLNLYWAQSDRIVQLNVLTAYHMLIAGMFAHSPNTIIGRMWTFFLKRIVSEKDTPTQHIHPCSNQQCTKFGKIEIWGYAWLILTAEKLGCIILPPTHVPLFYL